MGWDAGRPGATNERKNNPYAKPPTSTYCVATAEELAISTLRFLNGQDF
jgi:hypothetical protein